MADILIYGSIDSYSSSEFIQEIDESEDTELNVRINSNGGGPEYAWGMVAKFNEFEGVKKVKVDGKAFSSAMFFTLYTDDVSALDVSEFLIHRAAYPDWIESSSDFNAEMRGNLIRINKSLETAFRNKVDISKFESLPQMEGKTTKDIFSMDSRIDVFLTAQEAKKIGLINKIVKITPDKKAQIEAKMFEITANHNSVSTQGKNKLVQTKKIEKMTIEEIRAKHPEVYGQILAEGIAKEKDRVGAWMVFNGIDAAAVAVGVNSGGNISQTAMAEFSLKGLSVKTLDAVASEATPPIETKKPEATAEKTELELLEARLNGELKTEGLISEKN